MLLKSYNTLCAVNIYQQRLVIVVYLRVLLLGLGIILLL